MSGSKDTVYYGTAECSNDAKTDEDDRCDQLRKENKAKYHLLLHHQAFRALSTRIRNPQSISPQAINDPNVCPGCTDNEGNGMRVSKESVCSCKAAGVAALCRSGSLGT